MKDRFTYRPDQLSKQYINVIHQLFKEHNQPKSYNAILNMLVINKASEIKLPKGKIRKNKSNYKSSDYRKVASNFAKVNDAINRLNRIIYGGYSNLNQLTRKVNENEINLDPNDLKKYKKLILKSKNGIKKIESEVTKAWLKM